MSKSICANYEPNMCYSLTFGSQNGPPNGWYCSLKPFSVLYPFDEKCMKAILDEEYRFGGIRLPQYFPITLAVFESPSYKVKES